MATYDAGELFGPWEKTISGWDGLLDEIKFISNVYPGNSFVWRGQSDAAWGLKSSLYRSLETELGSPPSEEQLIAAERKLLRLARIDWRLDGIPALQLFARLQHVGAPTRLLDVTANPLIAAWFAVSGSGATDDKDARLFAFVNNRRPLQLNSSWNTNTPRWHQLHTDEHRRAVGWGTGLGRKIWRPPALHNRIPAQNAAFIVDGIPLDTAETGRVVPDEPSRWTVERLRKYISVPLKLSRPREGRLPKENAPVFTYRILSSGRKEIRHELEERFGFRFATIYADIEGLAQYMRETNWLGEL
ncbi:FRG domain-containing protein [Humibacter ginsenosidimutans]|uniref:FRG domain-containing protein n=1 Tax=Humibacter ginsenosidimutans TaxID=2599293 RepID=A0A5B8M7X0_9MICO|nr:FRG domain-containing protein [Humibacter ginsenosidimutans]QDZ16299.1 FRG domain-containing protein [Humibacter ginsenosidimutans]